MNDVMQNSEQYKGPPGGPMTSQKLRTIADWLDTYDALAEDYFTLLEDHAYVTEDKLANARDAVDGKDVQSDLRRWADEIEDQSQTLHEITAMHIQGIDETTGMTDGYCVECGWVWPCRTAHVANGWGRREQCEEEGWCQHAGVKLPRPSDD